MNQSSQIDDNTMNQGNQADGGRGENQPNLQNQPGVGNEEVSALDVPQPDLMQMQAQLNSLNEIV